MPLLPLGAYVVIDGSDTVKGFQGVEIPPDLRSLLAGYSRVWLGLAALIAAFYAGIMAPMVHIRLPVGEMAALIVLLSPIATAGAMFYILWTPSPRYLPVQLGLLALSGVSFLFTYLPPVSSKESVDGLRIALYVANVAAGLCSLTRLWNRCSYKRAIALGRRLGIPPEQIAPHYVAHAAGAETLAPNAPKIPEDLDASNHFTPSTRSQP
jgi:hypothetical protein